MNAISKFYLFLLTGVVFILVGCSTDDGGGPAQTPEQIQTTKLLGRWEPGTVIQEIDGEITDDRFSDFSITFDADAEGSNKKYTITNSGGEAFESGTKDWDYVDGNLNRIMRLDNGFEFDISLSNNDMDLQITLTVDESGSPVGRTSNTTGGYTFNLEKVN
ncbi:MAG: hypothetical protein DHS20C17_04300 [Cyclobacteriaceae bacterium]|nr:MAG: hypothetical protein DHS20C17_04300 [Cyclobacteriaceae bacterium]